MRKIYSLIASLVIGMIGFAASAQDIEGAYYVKGDFWTVSAASDANPRANAFSFYQGQYNPEGQYGVFTANTADNPFNIKAQNESQTCYVYINNQEVANSETGVNANMFDAQVTLANSDVVKIYDHQPYWTSMTIGFMQEPSKVADKVIVTSDEIRVVLGLEADNYTDRCLEGTKYEIKAVEGADIKAVYYCNEDVEPVDGVYTVYADREGDALIIIDMGDEIPGQADDATYYISGSFYIFTAQSEENQRIEPISVAQGEYAGEYHGFAFQHADNPFILKGYNESNDIHVYLNNTPVPNSEVGELANGFQAPVTFTAGDVLKVYGFEPYWTNMSIGFFEPAATVADKVVVTMDETVPVTGLDDDSFSLYCLQGTKFEIKAAEGAEIKAVYYCNDDVEAVDGVYTVYADRAGDAMIIIEFAHKGQGISYVAGDFYTFVAQNENNNRDEAVNITYGSYAGEYGTFEFAEGTTYVLKGMNESKDIHAYINNVEVANTEAGEMHEMYEAPVTFADGDVLKVYGFQPYWTNMGIGFFQDPKTVADKVIVTMDGITPVEGLDVDNYITRCLQGTKFQIKAAEGAEIKAVYYCNDDVEAEDGVYTVYADREGDALIIIDMVQKGQGVTYIAGDFYNFVAQNENNNRDEAIAFAYGNYAGEYGTFDFAEGTTYVLKGMNESKDIHVYINNTEVANTDEGVMHEMYEAPVTFSDGDVVKIFGFQPYWTNMGIGFFQDPKSAASKVSVTMDGVTAVEGLDVDNYTTRCLQGTKFQIKAAAGGEIKAVYYCNEDVEPVDGVYTVYADRQGDALIIIDLVEKETAVAYINGDFYTFVAQNQLDNRDEAFAFPYNSYFGEYSNFEFTAGATYDLKGYNANNEFHVFLNNVEVDNTEVGEMAQGFQAPVTFNSGDVIKIYSFAPYWTNMHIGFMSDPATADKMVEVVMDGTTVVEGLDTDGDYSVRCLQGTKFTVTPLEGTVIKAVYYCNNDVMCEDGVYTVYGDREGDALIIIDIDYELSGVRSISTEAVRADGNVYSIQGALLIKGATSEQISNLRPGMYIINGRKAVIR